MIEGMAPVDFNDVRQKAIKAWFPELKKINVRYAIKYASRLQEVDPQAWKDAYNEAISSEQYDQRVEERKKRYKTGGRFTLGAMQNIPNAVEYVYENLLSKAFDPSLARYIKAALTGRYTEHSVQLIFVSIGFRYGWVEQVDADSVKTEINTAASNFWAQFSLPDGYSITETWEYLTDQDGASVTIEITTPE